MFMKEEEVHFVVPVIVSHMHEHESSSFFPREILSDFILYKRGNFVIAVMPLLRAAAAPRCVHWVQETFGLSRHAF